MLAEKPAIRLNVRPVSLKETPLHTGRGRHFEWKRSLPWSVRSITSGAVIAAHVRGQRTAGTAIAAATSRGRPCAQRSRQFTRVRGKNPRRQQLHDRIALTVG